MAFTAEAVGWASGALMPAALNNSRFLRINRRAAAAARFGSMPRTHGGQDNRTPFVNRHVHLVADLQAR